ncbi:MAG: hypothetical protein WC471_03785 [Candidatus Woesearchaeota archaeon]
MNKYLVALVLIIMALVGYEVLNERGPINADKGWLMDTNIFFRGSVDWTPVDYSTPYPRLQLANQEVVGSIDIFKNKCPKDSTLVGTLKMDYWTGTSDEEAEYFAKHFAVNVKADGLIELDSFTNVETAFPELIIRTTTIYYVIRKDGN